MSIQMINKKFSVFKKYNLPLESYSIGVSKVARAEIIEGLAFECLDDFLYFKRKMRKMNREKRESVKQEMADVLC